MKSCKNVLSFVFFLDHHSDSINLAAVIFLVHMKVVLIDFQRGITAFSNQNDGF